MLLFPCPAAYLRRQKFLSLGPKGRRTHIKAVILRRQVILQCGFKRSFIGQFSNILPSSREYPYRLACFEPAACGIAKRLFAENKSCHNRIALSLKINISSFTPGRRIRAASKNTFTKTQVIYYARTLERGATGLS